MFAIPLKTRHIELRVEFEKKVKEAKEAEEKCARRHIAEMISLDCQLFAIVDGEGFTFASLKSYNFDVLGQAESTSLIMW